MAILAAVVIAALIPRAYASTESGYPVITSVMTEQFGSRSMAFCTFQDPNGILYFGSNGLLTYDGTRWQHHAIPGIRYLYSIDSAPDGRLWVASEGDIGWLKRNGDSSWEYHSLAPKLPEGGRIRGQAWQVFSDGQGAVFVTSEEVYRWDGEKMTSWKLPGTRRVIGFVVEGKIHIHHRLTGLHRFENGELKLIVPQHLIEDEMGVNVLWADQTPNGLLLVKARGLELLRDGVLKPFAPEVSKLIDGSNPSSATRMQDGRYIIGTGRRGIIVMRPDGTLDAHLTEENGLPATYVHSVFVDREANLWAMTMTRAIRVNLNPAVRVFDTRANISPEAYRVLTRSNGRLVVGSRIAALALVPERNRFEMIGDSEGFSHNLMPSRRGLLSLGFSGAWIMENGKRSAFVRVEGDVQAGLESVFRPGFLYLAQSVPPAIHAVSPDGSTRVVASNMRMRATSLAEERDRLWIGTEVGELYTVDLNATSSVTPAIAGAEHGLPALEGRATVRNNSNGEVFVFADNGGWVKHAGHAKFVPIDNFPARPVAAAADFASAGTSWILHGAMGSRPAFVATIVVERGRARWVPHSVPEMDSIGVPLGLFAEIGTEGKTVLWIGGTSGIMKHVVEHGPVAPRPRQPLLDAFATTDKNARIPIPAELPFATRGVEFQYAQPEFCRSASLRFETRIDGIDSDWMLSTPDGRRELTALRDGTYTLSVRTLAETGVASVPTSLTFRILPPWWRTTPAFALAALLLTGGAYTGYRLRVRALHRRTTLLEQKVQERTEELAAASAAKTMFVANMSHDIRNPLNGIVGLALALEDTRLDAQQRELVATLRECTTYLSSLVDDVLDFASIEAGKLELRPGPFVPSELLNSVVTALKAQAAEKDAFITIESDPDLPPVLRGDAGRIQQILVNYVTNAFKYAGGHIRLAVSLAPNSREEVEFSVADDGPGIDAADQANLFTKFSRLESARHDGIKGTGLGLASCRLLADFMGGSVGVESTPGQGARFFLRLPLSIATEPAPVAADDTLPSVTVLLVEDTDYNAMAAVAVLRRLGLTCDRAATGEEAVRLFKETRHNIVLLDRNLPDIDGVEVARRMREIETDGLRSVLLAVTAYCTPEDKDLCISAGMDAFVGKPLTPEKLRRVLVDAGRKMLAAAVIDAPPKPELDTSLLEYLSDGTEGGVAAQAERFISALGEAHQAVLAARASGNAADLGTAAHRVLGHARMIGATRLSEVAVQLESAAKRTSEVEITNMLPKLATEVAVLTEALRRHPRAQKA